MWFKNLKIYTLDTEKLPSLSNLEDLLYQHRFVQCQSAEPSSYGWVPPVLAQGNMLYFQNGHALLTFRQEIKVLPQAAVKLVVKDRAIKIAEQQGFRPGRKQLKEIAEQIILEMLPKAFVTQKDTNVWLDIANGRFLIDTSSTSVADAVISHLASFISPFPVGPLFVERAPSAAMTSWLLDGEVREPYAEYYSFNIDDEVELRAFSGDSRATVKYIKQYVEPEEARSHIQLGKQVTKMALTWQDRVSFVLTDDLDLKKIEALDLKTEGETELEVLESEFALMTGELSKLLNNLIQSLGGQKAEL